MKKFIDFCILFVLYVYTNYIKEDWSFYTKWGKIYYYPAWFIRSCLIWLISPMLLIDYFFKQSSIYKYIQDIKTSPEYAEYMIKHSNLFKF